MVKLSHVFFPTAFNHILVIFRSRRLWWLFSSSVSFSNWVVGFFFIFKFFYFLKIELDDPWRWPKYVWKRLGNFLFYTNMTLKKTWQLEKLQSKTTNKKCSVMLNERCFRNIYIYIYIYIYIIYMNLVLYVQFHFFVEKHTTNKII